MGWRLHREAPLAAPGREADEAAGAAAEHPLGSGYLVFERIGQGQMGEVYRATDRAQGRPLAVKILRPGLTDDHEIVGRFVQERSILMSLQDDHLVRVHDLVVESDTLAIVMDHVDGPALRAYLRERGRLPAGEAVAMVCQVLGALDVVHEHGVVHRDVKPENVLLSDIDGVWSTRLADFGVARLLDAPQLTRASGLIGTPAYLAPELVDGGRPAPSADVYAVGVMLFELVTGRCPAPPPDGSGATSRAMEANGLPAGLLSVMAALLDPDPAARPGAADAAHDLALAAEAGGIDLSMPRSGRPAGVPIRRIVDRPSPEAQVPARTGRAVPGRRPSRAAPRPGVWVTLILVVLALAVVLTSLHGPRPRHAELAAAATSSTLDAAPTAPLIVPPGTTDSSLPAASLVDPGAGAIGAVPGPEGSATPSGGATGPGGQAASPPPIPAGTPRAPAVAPALTPLTTTTTALAYQPSWKSQTYSVHHDCALEPDPYFCDFWTTPITTYAAQARIRIVVNNGAGGSPCGEVRFHLFVDDTAPVTDTRWVGFSQPTRDTGENLVGNMTTPPRPHQLGVQAESTRVGCVVDRLSAWDGVITVSTYS